VPLYSVDEFKRLAPQEARTDHVLSDDHQLMLNRLSFELAERQRLAFPSDYMSTHPNLTTITPSLDLKKKELTQCKEDLLKESKSKLSTMDNVKTQIETLMKASSLSHSLFISPLFILGAFFFFLQTASEIQKKVDELVQPIPGETDDTPG